MSNVATDNSTTPPSSTPAPQKPRLVLSFGLAALISSFLLYSATITPFQKFPGINTFIATFAECSLGIALIASIAITLYSATNHHLPTTPLLAYGGTFSIIGAIAFVALSITVGLPGEFIQGVAIASSCASSLGGVALCLVWGRIFKQLDLNQALYTIAIAALIIAFITALEFFLPEPIVVILLGICTISAALLPWKLGVPDDTPGSNFERVMTQKLASFTDVIAAPALGLFSFAFIMGSMRELFIPLFFPYILGLIAASALLMFAIFHKKKTPLAQFAYQKLLPLLAVGTLALSNITLALGEGTSLGVFFTLFLYVFTALLTLGTLCAIAHAAEFSCDLVFSTALVLFTTASIIGLIGALFIPSELVGVVFLAVTALYTLAIVFIQSTMRADDREAKKEGESETTRRCVELAEHYALTKREQEILLYLSEGHTGAYIAETLFISPNTARTHVHNIYRKLQVSSREDILQLTRNEVKK